MVNELGGLPCWLKMSQWSSA